MNICNPIYIIGHSTLEIDRFIAYLKAFDIEKLIDVRSYAGSRYVPQFNKENLEIYLNNAKIEYYHLLKLGGRRKSSNSCDYNLVDGWKNQSFKNYASYTLTKEYEEGILELITEAKNKIVCIMCAESVPWRCHRLLISNTLIHKEIEVYHIITESQAVPHELNKYGATAEIQNNQIIYPK